VPRWIFEAWLWFTVVAAALFDFGCDGTGLGELCNGLSRWGWPVLFLPPSAFDGFFSDLFGSRAVALVLTVAGTAGCHLLLRRYAPRRVSWRWVLLGYLAAMLVTGMVTFIDIYVAFFARHMSFADYLRGAWRLLSERKA
jgi:hypothetical protein